MQRMHGKLNLGVFLTLVFTLLLITPVWADVADDIKLSRLEQVNIVPVKNDVQVHLTFNKEIEFNSMVTHEPESIIIDIKNAWYKELTQKIESPEWLLAPLEIVQYLDGVRVTINLKYGGPWHDIYWDKKSKTLKLIIHREFSNFQSVNLAPGVTYHQIRQGLAAGPVRIQVLEVEVPDHPEGRAILAEIHGKPLPKPKVSLKTALHRGSLAGFTRVSNLVKQEKAFAGINGNFFSGNGSPLGLLIQNGQIVNEPLYNRTAWGIAPDGRMYMAQVSMKTEVTINGKTYSVKGFNRPRQSGEMVVYNAAYGKSTETNQWGRELVIRNNQVVAINTNNSTIPADGMVLSGHGAEFMQIFDQVRVGDSIKVNVRLTPDFLKLAVKEAIGGGPRLVEYGRVSITGQAEKFQSDILNGRAPRTALGITPDNHLLMVVVDGRSDLSVGMTLEELADLMIYLGAEDAMNLDGGSSSTFVLRGMVYNSPLKGEVGVNNGLVLFAEPFIK